MRKMPSDSMIYWDSMDFDSEDNSDGYSVSPEASLRQYVDPWDLENYAYMRKHLESTPDPSSTPSPAGEPTDSTFYYVPGVTARSRRSPHHALESLMMPVSPHHSSEHVLYATNAHFAGIDEAQFMNDNIMYHPDIYVEHNEPIYVSKRKVSPAVVHREAIYGRTITRPSVTAAAAAATAYSDLESSSEYDEDSSPVMTDGPLLYMYETGRRRRSMAVPVKRRSSVFESRRHSMAVPPPRDYDRYGSQSSDYYSPKSTIYGGPVHSNYGYKEESIYSHRPERRTSNVRKVHREVPHEDIYGVFEEPIYGKHYVHNHPREIPVPIYDETLLRRPKPENFGLSNYGHLKIDYSCSWNSLDRFIGK